MSLRCHTERCVLMTIVEFERLCDWLTAEFEHERALVQTEADARVLRAKWLGKKGVIRYLEYRLVGRDWPHQIPGG